MTLPSQPVVVVQPVQHRNRHKLASQWLRISQALIRIRYPVQPLMHAPVVVPADEFLDYPPKMPFIPDQHSVETLPAKRPYQPLHVCRRIGRAIRNRYPPNPHLLPEPHIVGGSTAQPRAGCERRVSPGLSSGTAIPFPKATLLLRVSHCLPKSMCRLLQVLPSSIVGRISVGCNILEPNLKSSNLVGSNGRASTFPRRS
jgi:hypothetical protein